MYPFLVQYDEHLEIAPDFAASWETSADGKTWTFHLQEGAMWSDGRPLTAEDAAWTINTTVKFADGPTGNRANTVLNVKRATATDPTTLDVSYSAPVGPALAKLNFLPILPKHVWEKNAAGNGAAMKTYANTPDGGPVVCGGPFVLEKYQKNQIALFKRNERFYGDKPLIDGFGIRYFSNPDDQNLALINDEIDVIPVIDDPSVVKTLQAKGVKILESGGAHIKTFIINSNPKKPMNRELLEPKVREAFAHALNRQRMVDVAWLGHAKPGGPLIPASVSEWTNAEIKPEEYSLEKANQLLDEAGYRKGADGVREANGHRMSYTMLPAPSTRPLSDRYFQIVRDDFAKIGVELKAKRLDDAAFFPALTAPGDKGYGEFDLAMWDWSVQPDPDFLLGALTSSQWGNFNDSGYANPEYDKLWKQQGSTVDEAARHQIVDQMQELIHRDKPYTILAVPNALAAHSPKWTGLFMTPNGPLQAAGKKGLLKVSQA